ncbi:hypothetical protein BC628DRAFT_138845 [Trametes gibbosa]|nr:hypothetical protein BC628DRAFT_138845 [Trametes gibbosa]
MGRRMIGKRFTSCGEACLSQTNCLVSLPRGGTSCLCQNRDSAFECLTDEECSIDDVTELGEQLALCDFQNMGSLTDNDGFTEATVGFTTSFFVTSNPTPSPTSHSTHVLTATTTASRTSVNSTPTPSANPINTGDTTRLGPPPTVTPGTPPASSQSPRSSNPISSDLRPSLSSPISFFASSSAPLPSLSSPAVTTLSIAIFPSPSTNTLVATVISTPSATHGPSPKVIIALSTSLVFVLFVAVGTALVLFYRSRRRFTATRDIASREAASAKRGWVCRTGTRGGRTV